MADSFLIPASSGATTNGAGDLTASYNGPGPHFYIVTVAVGGTYEVTIDGAEGGGTAVGATAVGGFGASVTGDIVLTAGETLEIAVGGVGATGHLGSGGGGGGGSFIFEDNGGVLTPLAIAGGGGGAGYVTSASTHGGHAGGEGLAAAAGGAGGVGGISGTITGGLGGVPGATTPAVGAGGGVFGGGGGGFTGGHGGSTGAAGSGLDSGPLIHFSGGAGAGLGDPGGFGGGGGGGAMGGGGGGGWGGGGGGAGVPTATMGIQDYGGGGGGGGSYDAGLTGAVETAGGASAINGADSGNGQITIDLVCFAQGTRIRAAAGEIPVEHLKAGDQVLTASGSMRPVVWVGHRAVSNTQVVRVAAGAFGEALPSRDLYLSPGHAVCVSVVVEVFVPVGELVNGSTITRMEVPEITYWHVELESHDVLLADGLPCESYMDAGNRVWFGREYGRLEAVDQERVAESLTRYARPFVAKGPVVAAIRARLGARAAVVKMQAA